MTELERELAGSKQGGYLCPTYESFTECLATITLTGAPFVRKQRCHDSAANRILDPVASALGAEGADVYRDHPRGVLQFPTRWVPFAAGIDRAFCYKPMGPRADRLHLKEVVPALWDAGQLHWR